jgi:signal transduction histidine kinase
MTRTSLRLPGLVCLLLLAASCLLAGCGTSIEEVNARQERVARRGARRIRADLEGLLARARAVARAAPDLAQLGRAARFDALEALRRAHAVDGLLWEDPAGEGAWAGRVIEPHAPEDAGPWKGSLRVRDVALHVGPMVSALVVGPLPVSIGHLSVTLVLDERPHPGQGPPYARRWLEPLGLAEVRIEPPGAALPEEADAAWAQEGVRATPDEEPVLAVSTRSHGVEATFDRFEARVDRRVGRVALGGVAVLVGLLAFFVVRRVPRGVPRAWATAILILLTRAALAGIDLPTAFPGFAQGFAPTDFGVEDPLGWLASPGDLALTAGAFLLAVVLVLRAHRATPARSPGRTLAAPLGLALTAASTLLWVECVALAVAQGHTPFFQSTSFLPPWPTTLMLLALVGLTAAVILLATHGLRLVARTLPSLGTPWARLLGAAGALACAWAVAGRDHALWALALLPLAAALAPARVEPGGESRSAGRVLLLGVLATALLFPVLWARVSERRRDHLGGLLERLAGHSAQAQSDATLDLTELAGDRRLAEALEAAATGPRPEGLALSIWLASALSRPEQQGVVSVLDAHGRLLDEFSLDSTPRKRLPTPVPPTGGSDLQVVTLRGDALTLGCVVGRLRVRSPGSTDAAGGAVLGHVVLTLPDPTALLLLGLPATAALADREDALAAGRRPLEVAVLSQGRVLASSSAQVSREPGGFGPPQLATLSAERPNLAWDDATSEGAAAYLPERGTVLALRRKPADLGEVVLALARLVVVGVGTALLAALLVFLVTLRGFRVRLHHRILVSYFVVSVIPLVLLAWASAGETRMRHDQAFGDRLDTDLSRARGELEAHEARVFDVISDETLRRAAFERRHDVILYRAGRVSASSRAGSVEAEVQASRLPAEAYRATVLERRATVRRETGRDGRPVWTGYAPLLGPDGHALATVAVPLLYDRDRIEEELTVTGSVVLASYLLTLVLVLAVGIYAARWIARPLDELAHGTAQVARGDLEVVLPGEGPDEVGQLVVAFNAMTRDLKAATERAARAEREEAWRRMARQVAHEIKNPLSPMKLMVQQMEADIRRDPSRASETIQRTAGVLLRQIDALARIAGTFGDLARLPVRHLVAVDLAALVQHVVDLHVGARAHGVTVDADLAPGLPRVEGDEDELRRVLVNLVNNAVQSIQGSGRVAVRARPAPDQAGRPGVRLEIEDTGQGIAAEHRALLFEPTFSTKTSGTGLGLAIVKRIVDDLGGTVTFESHPGRGSTFRVWLPERQIAT